MVKVKFIEHHKNNFLHQKPPTNTYFKIFIKNHQLPLQPLYTHTQLPFKVAGYGYA